MQMAAFLTDRGVRVDIKDNKGQTCLFIVKGADCAATLTARACDPNLQDNQGQSALFFAAAEKREQVMRMLLEKKLDAMVLDRDNKSALHFASDAPCTELLIG